jgi:hypothetical protein
LLQPKPTRRRSFRVGLCLAAALLAAGCLHSQLPESFVRGYDRLVADLQGKRQPPKDTEFVFARVRFTSNGPGRGPGYDHRTPGWSHDYPNSEEHILGIASEVTNINLNKESHVIVDLDSPDLFKYPFAYFSEVGEMTLTDKEVVNLREYLNRGGFIIMDDFDSPSFNWFTREMQKVFPQREFVKLTASHPLFSTFYGIDNIDLDPPYEQPGKSGFMGYHDERGRMLIVGNVNNDLGDYWEWIDQPQYPLPPGTAALRFGVNYLLYGMTH